MTSMAGKTVVITGATSGIGLAAAVELARMGARVVGISRSQDRCSRATEHVREQTGNGDVGMFCADLSSMRQVRQVAMDVLAQQPRIDVLVNNAGAMYLSRRVSPDGFEMTFALNHLAGFLLTQLLLDRLVESAPARVINVSSNAQFGGKMHFDDLQLARGYGFMKAYAQSKLANMLFTYELERRHGGRGVTFNVMHPGLVRTNFGADNSSLARIVQRWILRGARTPERGARTIVLLAASAELEGVSGRYFVDEQQARSSARSYDQAGAARLWESSEAMLASLSSQAA